MLHEERKNISIPKRGGNPFLFLSEGAIILGKPRKVNIWGTFLKKLGVIHSPSRDIPAYNDPELYSDSELEHPSCQIRVREVAAVLRSALSGEIDPKRLSDSRFEECIPGDLFEIMIQGYAITFFVDDPGTYDYIQTVTYEDKTTRENEWIYSPEDLLSEDEEIRLQQVLEKL